MKDQLKRCPHRIALATSLVFCALFTDTSNAYTKEKWHWSNTFPPGFEAAANAHKHAATFDEKKSHKFQTTGKIADLFSEVGRPDKFSKQGFTNKDNPHTDKPAKLNGSFLYEFKDGKRVYVGTAAMDWVDLALAYKGNKLLRLLYK